MAWVESNCPSDCGIVWGNAKCDDNSQRLPSPPPPPPPDLSTIAWAATLDPGYHSFLKEAIRIRKYKCMALLTCMISCFLSSFPWTKHFSTIASPVVDVDMGTSESWVKSVGGDTPVMDRHSIQSREVIRAFTYHQLDRQQTSASSLHCLIWVYCSQIYELCGRALSGSLNS